MKRTLFSFVWLGLFWTLLANVACTQQAVTDSSVVKRVPPDTVQALLAKKDSLGLLLLDVRTPEEFMQGHIPGAKLIPVQVLEQEIKQIEAYKDKPVIVYCRSGNRSRTASRILAKHGFKIIYDMDGGIRQWKGPIVR